MNIKFHFFGKDCLIDRSLQNRSELTLALQEKNISSQKILFLNQIHSPEVVIIDSVEKIYDAAQMPKADAIVSNLPNIVLGLFTADCAPILFFDEKEKIIGATHAGWRGAKLGVIKSTIAAMKKLGAKNIVAQVGPMIQQKSYEVSGDFFRDFLSEKSGNEKFFIPNKNDLEEKYLFDLPSYINEKLSQENLAEIKISPIDTYTNSAKFFSFRRSTHLKETDCGRNISVIEIS